MSDRENLHRLSPEELNLVYSFRRLTPDHQEFIERMVRGALQIDSQTRPASNVITLLPAMSSL